MAKKLYYFNLNGIAESIRYILHYSGQKFEDVRYDRAAWPKAKHIKDSLPYGQLPLYEENGKTINQSLAIARYLASQVNLLPTDPWEQAVLDAVVFSIYDFWARVLPFIIQKDPATKEKIKKQILNEFVDFFFSRFEKELKTNNGYFGGKLTWVDFVFVGIVETTNLFLETEIEKKYPSVTALIQKIHNLPGVKEYIASREPYTV